MQLAPSHEGTTLDVEDVGEVGFDCDLDRQPHRPAGVVDDVVVLVNAAAKGSVQTDRDRVRVDPARIVDEVPVGELEACREELDGR